MCCWKSQNHEKCLWRHGKMAQNDEQMSHEESGQERWVLVVSRSQDELEDDQRCPKHLIQLTASASAKSGGLETWFSKWWRNLDQEERVKMRPKNWNFSSNQNEPVQAQAGPGNHRGPLQAPALALPDTASFMQNLGQNVMILMILGLVHNFDHFD